MINKRLIALIEESKKIYWLDRALPVDCSACQYCIYVLSGKMIEALFMDYFVLEEQLVFIALCLIAIVIRYFCKLAQHKTSFYAAKRVKKNPSRENLSEAFRVWSLV